MKILFLTRLFNPHIGGVEKHVLEISKDLIKRGHSVSVVTENYNNILHHNEIIDGIKIYRIPLKTTTKLKKYKIWSWFWKNRRIIKEADIVHCHDVTFWFFPFKILMPSKKIYTTFHGYETEFPLKKRAIIIRKISEKISAGNICVGEYIKKWYRTKADYVVYGGINTEKHKDTLATSKDINLKIIYIGRLEKDNGIDVYINLLKELQSKKVKFSFSIYGDGTYRKALEEFGTVYGFQNNIEPAINASDMVFASSYLSILEAFKYKKIVCSVYQNELKKDYLKMTPFYQFLILGNDTSDLAQKILLSLKKNKINDDEYQWVKDQTWESLSDIYLKLWKI